VSQEKKKYDFKAVGQTLEESNNTVAVIPGEGLPLSIATPVRLSQKNGTLFEMHTTIAQQVKDNFRNMLSTNHGERVMLSDFGANLRPLAYELGAEDSDTAAITRISATTKKYMPYINLETFEPIRELSDDGALSRVGVRITYSVPSAGITSTVVDALILSTG
jgi:phage baseplate assembly protein W